MTVRNAHGHRTVIYLFIYAFSVSHALSFTDLRKLAHEDSLSSDWALFTAGEVRIVDEGKRI